MPKSMDWAKSIGESLRRVRGRARQEDIAKAAREMGVEWTKSTVAGIERGSRQLEVRELLLLPWILRRATGLKFELADFFEFATDQWIQLTPQTKVHPSALAEVIDGHAHKSGVGSAIMAPFVVDHLQAMLSKRTSEKSARKLEALGDAEQKAARTLGVEPATIVSESHAIWGQTLSAERDARIANLQRGEDVPARRLQAVRGHVTRTLLREMREAWDRTGGKP